MGIPPPSLKTRQQLLVDYLREVARDLVMRGIIKAQQGVGLADVLREEPQVMLESVVEDLKRAGLAVGEEVISGLVAGVLGAFFKR